MNERRDDPGTRAEGDEAFAPRPAPEHGDMIAGARYDPIVKVHHGDQCAD